MQHNQGEMETTEAGAKRESNKGRGRFDLLPYEALEAWAIWSEEGALKYGPRNWEKGLLVSDCINRLVRHAIKAANGWVDEDHLAACMWNAGAAKTMMKRRPDLNDHPWQDSINSTDEEPTTLYADGIPYMTLKNSDEYHSEPKPDWTKASPGLKDEQVLSEKEAKKRQDAINKQVEDSKCVEKADKFNDPSLTKQWQKAMAEQVEEAKRKIRKSEINHKYGLFAGNANAAKIKGISLDEYIANELGKKELEELDRGMKESMDQILQNFDKKLLAMFRSITCLAENDRTFLRLSIDCEGLDIPGVEKWLTARKSLENEEFPKPEDPDTICGMSRRDFFLKKISATPTNLTRLEVRDDDTHEYDQVGISYFMEYAEKHPDYEIAEVAVIANKTVYRCRPKL